MTTLAGSVRDDIEEELKRQGAMLEDFDSLPESEEAEIEENPFGHLEKYYPKPTASDVTSLRDWLQEYYRPLHEGRQLYATNENREGQAYTGIVGLRKLRYGQDTTSDKLYRRLSNDVRVRSMQSHNLIFKVRSLLSRNPIQVSVPAESGSGPAISRATKETRWSNELSKAFARRGTFNPFQESDDAQCEAFGGWVFFLREAWDDIDMEPGEGDEDEGGQPTKDYEERIGRQKRERGLPFGIRALDPLSTLIDPTDDGEGINAAIIVEKKRARPLLEKLKDKDTELHERVKAGAFGGSGFDPTSYDGEFETIQYWDACWYVYMVEGTVVTIEKHGLPGVPVFPAWGFITSARNMGDKFQGVAYALQMTEAIANDVLTQEIDSRLTYNRVKPIAEAEAGVSEPDEEIMDLQGPELKLLPPGYVVKDLFQGFRSTAVDPSISTMIGLGAQQSAPSVMSGQSPSADASGYSLNLLTQNAIGPYSALLENKANAWGNCVDFIRKTVKYTLRESVPLPIPQTGENGETTVEWLEIAPDEISDIPCLVTVDPTSDLEKIAISKWLLEGVAGDFVPPRILQEQGYGSKDASAWDEEIIRAKAKRMFAQNLVQLAYQELIQEIQATQEPAAVNMPNGQQVAGTDNPTGLPREARPSTVGAQPGGTAGQMPSGQPTQQAAQYVGGPPA